MLHDGPGEIGRMHLSGTRTAGVASSVWWRHCNFYTTTTFSTTVRQILLANLQNFCRSAPVERSPRLHEDTTPSCHWEDPVGWRTSVGLSHAASASYDTLAETDRTSVVRMKVTPS